MVVFGSQSHSARWSQTQKKPMGWRAAASPGFTRAVFMGTQHINGFTGETASDCAAEIQKALQTVKKKPQTCN